MTTVFAQQFINLILDPVWGVSNAMVRNRTMAAKFTRKYYEYDASRLLDRKRLTQVTAYDRCKANRRCNWGIVGEWLQLLRCLH